MATNYTLAEAAKIVREGTNIEAIQEIGKRFPLLFASLIKVTTKAGKDFDDFIDCMPDYLTANKMNAYIKAKLSDENEDDNAAEDNTAEEDDEPVKKSEKKQAKATKAKEEDEGDEDNDESDYDSMTTKDLWVLVKSRPEAKKFIKGNARKDELIAALKKADAEGGASNEDDDDADEDEDSYEGMSALELFKECKKRGIKATPKKKEKYYIDLLKKDDASKAEEAEEEDDDDDWDDESEEEVKPTKKDKKADKKSKAKPKKEEPEDDDDDDDDWDI